MTFEFYPLSRCFGQDLLYFLIPYFCLFLSFSSLKAWVLLLRTRDLPCLAAYASVVLKKKKKEKEKKEDEKKFWFFFVVSLSFARITFRTSLVNSEQYFSLPNNQGAHNSNDFIIINAKRLLKSKTWVQFIPK